MSSLNISSAFPGLQNLYQLDRTIQTSSERLSTGSRLNGAADGPTSVAIASKLSAEVGASNAFYRSALSGISLFDAADSSAEEIGELINRFRELAVEANDSSITTTTRTNLNNEATEIASLITILAGDTKHNGTTTLDGTFTSKNIYLGDATTSYVSANINSAKADALGAYVVEGTTKSATSAATSATSNDISASESIVINTTTINATANEAASTFAEKINSVSGTTGVSATVETYLLLASTDASLTTYTIAVNGTSTASFTMSSGNASNAVAAINTISSTTGVTATETAANQALLHDNSGADVTIENENGSNSGLTVTAVARDGSTASGSAVSLAASGGNDATRVSGTIRLSADSSFSVLQNGTVSQGYFTGTHTITGATRGAITAGADSSAAANSTTVDEDFVLVSSSISAVAAESAKTLAARINALSLTPDITATAETNGLLGSTQSSSTTYTITINSNQTSSFTMSSSDVSAGVTAINAVSGSTGVTATATSDNLILLQDADGDDVIVTNDSANTGLTLQAVARDQSTTSGTVQALAATGGNDTSRLIGTLHLTADSTFSLTQSGTSSLAYFATGTAINNSTSASLSAMSTADLSSVQKAQEAITVADHALNQLNTIRSELGSLSQRLEYAASFHINQQIEKNIGLASLSDTDTAIEAARLAKAQMLKKISLAMQAQVINSEDQVIELVKSAGRYH